MTTLGVDLQGLMRVFGGHLYSTPAVFVRELVQNGIDAVALAGEPGRVVVRAGGDHVAFDDDGIGLDEEGLAHHLSRIGASSKRGEGRDPRLIGQFGIGLLSAFLVGERVVVETRTATGPPLRWEADAEGKAETCAGSRASRGTTVTVHLRSAASRWGEPDRLRAALIEMVPHVSVPVFLGEERISAPAPWLGDDPGRLRAWVDAREDDPLAVMRVRLGTSGAGAMWIRRAAAGLGGGRLDLYQHGVRVQHGASDVLPAWAGLLGGVLDLPGLAVTASREGFVRDEAWDVMAGELRTLVCGWLRDLGTGPLAGELYERHHLHLIAACLDDPSLLAALADGMPFATNAGPMALADIAQTGGGSVRAAFRRTDFAQVGPIAAARAELVVDASHVHERPFLTAWARAGAGRSLVEVDVSALTDFIEAAPEHEARFAPVLREASLLLSEVEVVPTIGRFPPADLPALLVADATRLRERVRTLTESGTPLQRALLAGLAVARRRDPVPLVLNVDNPLISALPGLGAPERAARAVRVVYAQAALAARHTLSPTESRWLSDDLLAVLRSALPQGGATVH